MLLWPTFSIRSAALNPAVFRRIWRSSAILRLACRLILYLKTISLKALAQPPQHQQSAREELQQHGLWSWLCEMNNYFPLIGVDSASNIIPDLEKQQRGSRV
jgi:hypothetical protein